MAVFTRNPNEATHRAEVVFRRDLSIQYGINEIETDYEVAFFKGEPTGLELTNMVPYGWEFVESHVSEIDEFDLDDDDDRYFHPFYEDPDYSLDDDLELEELELEAV